MGVGPPRPFARVQKIPPVGVSRGPKASVDGDGDRLAGLPLDSLAELDECRDVVADVPNLTVGRIIVLIALTLLR